MTTTAMCPDCTALLSACTDPCCRITCTHTGDAAGEPFGTIPAAPRVDLVKQLVTASQHPDYRTAYETALWTAGALTGRVAGHWAHLRPYGRTTNPQHGGPRVWATTVTTPTGQAIRIYLHDNLND